MKHAEPKRTIGGKLPASRRAAIPISEKSLTKTSLLNPDSPLPLVVQPLLESTSLALWAKNNPDVIEGYLLKHGGILFRGFDLKTHDAFQSFLDSAFSELMYYMEGATPRTRVSDKVYTSTEYPAEYKIALHNELTYVNTWPMKISFFCMTPASREGETPIADSRKVFGRIDPAVRDRFIEKGWMLVRNFDDKFGLPWQTAFRTDDRQALEEYFRNSQIEFEWMGNKLRTRQVRPAIARHPKTGDLLWFNHAAFWHKTSLQPGIREAMLSTFKDEDLPFNTFYGDGTEIDVSDIEGINLAYEKETVKFPWQKGDLLLLDNMLVAHGRSAYAGPRKILVGMGEPCSDRGL